MAEEVTREMEQAEQEHELPGRNNGETNLLDRLRQQREEIGQDRSLDVEVPGYEGDLVARYKVVPWDTMKKIATKLERSKSPRKELNAQADTIIEACDQILVRDGSELRPFNEVFHLGDEPVRYDARLASTLGFEAETARQVLFGLFNNDLAITSHHNEVAEWMASSRREDDRDFSD